MVACIKAEVSKDMGCVKFLVVSGLSLDCFRLSTVFCLSQLVHCTRGSVGYIVRPMMLEQTGCRSEWMLEQADAGANGRCDRHQRTEFGQ